MLTHDLGCRFLIPYEGNLIAIIELQSREGVLLLRVRAHRVRLPRSTNRIHYEVLKPPGQSIL